MKRSVLVCVVGLSACLGGGPSPPEQPETGPGGKEAKYGGSRMTEVGVGPQGARVYLPQDPELAAPAPLIVLLHGYQALSTEYYELWIDHLVRRGNVVVAPAWQTRATLPPVFTANAKAGLDAALNFLGDHAIPVDFARVVFLGHSGGGTLAVNLASLAGRGKLDIRPKVLFLAAPGRCIYCDQMHSPGIPVEPLGDVPADVYLAVINAQDDRDVGQKLGRHFYVRLDQVPAERKTYVEMRSDLYGYPALSADHRAPAAERNSVTWGTNALDYFGTWKLLDLVMACAFQGQDCDLAMGRDPAQRSMGRWSDGTPVASMLTLEEAP